ncbi:tail protein X [Volucribacter psittacicida]|uniref:Tail protein X n=1 Tax=Volucribacter psittacicida TaxID=203482 RepID=A0A4V2PB39_9PAST|nr:tail protein X [Volucribacter psittacicida]TCJ95965.1 tail protein X [Volucribacter psittacicida]
MTQQTLLKHIVKQGERWDLLSYQYYGNAFDYNRIIDANPHISFCEVLPTGAVIYIPVLNVKPTHNANMPPWLRGVNHD